MNNYRVEVIGQPGSSLQRSPHQYAGWIAHDLNDIQERLGDRWELVSCTDGPRPFTIVTIWKSNEPSAKLENLMTGYSWMLHFGHQIIDPDGWRANDGVSFEQTEIPLDEYRRRYNMCTVNSQQGKQDF